jgi:tight adherence protein C
MDTDLLLVDALVFAAVACAVFGVAAMMSDAANAPESIFSIRRGNSALERLLSRFGGKFVTANEKERANLNLMLLQAGYDSPQAAQTYYGVRILLGLGLLALTAAAFPLFALEARFMPVIALIAAVIGFMLPSFYVKARRSANQNQVRAGLPDMLDLMMVCSEAGLGLEMAIARVGEEITVTQPLLANLLQQISIELRAGRSKIDALKGFADRAGTADVISLVRLLVQSDALGTSMAQTLRVFAEEMQSHRMLKAEEMAQKISAKLSMVLVGCFMPAILIAVIAPIIFNIVRTWKGLAI